MIQLRTFTILHRDASSLPRRLSLHPDMVWVFDIRESFTSFSPSVTLEHWTYLARLSRAQTTWWFSIFRVAVSSSSIRRSFPETENRFQPFLPSLSFLSLPKEFLCLMWLSIPKFVFRWRGSCVVSSMFFVWTFSFDPACWMMLCLSFLRLHHQSICPVPLCGRILLFEMLLLLL